MRIAVLGMGTMGSALAEGLLQAGHEVVVYNRTAAKTAPLLALGASAAATAAEALAATQAAIFVLPDAQSLRELLLADATRAQLAGRRLLNVATTKPEEILAIAQDVAAHGGHLAEVSIMVGADALRARQGQFILGSAAADTDFWTALLASVGERVDVAGEVGDASKAETPILLASMFGVVTAAYAAAAAIKLNIPRTISEHYIPMAVPGSEYLLPNLLSRNYDACMASVDNFAVVSATAINTARTLGLPEQVLADMGALFSAAQHRGQGAKDGTAIIEELLNPALA
jgi:3-hydroxyisobutyrate dehydrogenase